MGLSFQNVSSSTTLGAHSFVLADSSSGNITLTLPYAGNVAGRLYQIKKMSTSNSVWVSGGGNLIDDTTPIELPESSSLASLKLISDGTQWYKMEQKDVFETVASDNLIGWWKFDEISGTLANDSSEHGLQGTLQNGITFTDHSIAGKKGRALAFDGSNDYISMGSSYNRPSTRMSIGVWVKLSAYNTEVIKDFQYNGGNSYGFLLKVEANGRVSQWCGNGSGGSTAVSSDIVELNSWIFLTSTYRDGTVQIYKNGVALAMSDITANPSIVYTGTGGLQISTTGSLTVSGDVDDVRIYNRVLTEDEIVALYDSGY